jgi:nucleoside-diphosphate-sugar epimerase
LTVDQLALPGGATILVTGGAGFIGSNLCHLLAGHGLGVRVLDNLSTGRLANLADIESQVDFVEGDLADLRRVSEAMRGADFVLHHAALPSVPRSIEQPLASHAANATGTLNVLVAAQAAGVKRLVYASSSSVYGNSPALPKQESMAAAPVSPYAATKLAGEHYCRVFHHLHSLEVVVLRYFNVFGPRQDPDSPYAAVIPRFIKSLLSGEPPTIYGDGEQSRDFTYVDNVAQANLLALTAPAAPGRILNIACQQATTLNQLSKMLNSILEVDLAPRYAPARPGEARHSLADVSLAASVLGYQPIITVEDGLRRTARYWRGQCRVAQVPRPANSSWERKP